MGKLNIGENKRKLAALGGVLIVGLGIIGGLRFFVFKDKPSVNNNNQVQDDGYSNGNQYKLTPPPVEDALKISDPAERMEELSRIAGVYYYEGDLENYVKVKLQAGQVDGVSHEDSQKQYYDAYVAAMRIDNKTLEDQAYGLLDKETIEKYEEGSSQYDE